MTDDNHARTRAALPLAGLIHEPPMLGYSSEWWDQRDREVAAMREHDATALEKSRITTRAGELRDNGFPELFVASALAELADTTAMRFVRVFRHLPSKLLVLAGGVGTGKTTAATWLALRGQDPRPGFIRVNELERRGRYDRNLGSWLADKTSLVVDDVGAEYLDGKGSFRSLMDEVVDTFYSNRRILVMTTNLRPRKTETGDEDQFVERYGERVWSRLHQLGQWGDCGTRDLRREPQS